jgi:DNA replication protein DnaC
MTTLDDDMTRRLKRLGLWGLLAHWQDYEKAPWLPKLLECEEQERAQRSLDRRIRLSHIGRFKPMADFDWAWPKVADRALVEELFSFGFVAEGANVVLVGPNGIGKTMIAKNLAHQGLLKGLTVRFVTASTLLNDLARQDSGRSLEGRLRKYTGPALLAVDEVGYLSYNARYADLLFEVVTRRYEDERATVITTNKAFSEWGEVFPNASCVVTLVDRLVHRSEIVKLDGESYRLKESQERAARRQKARRRPRE